MAITASEKQAPNLIRAILRVPRGEAAEVILAVENTAATGTLFVCGVTTPGSNIHTIASDDFESADDRVVLRLPTENSDISTVVATITCFAPTWEGMIKVTVAGQEVYRDYLNYTAAAEPSAGLIAGFTLNVV